MCTSLLINLKNTNFRAIIYRERFVCITFTLILVQNESFGGKNIDEHENGNETNALYLWHFHLRFIENTGKFCRKLYRTHLSSPQTHLLRSHLLSYFPIRFTIFTLRRIHSCLHSFTFIPHVSFVSFIPLKHQYSDQTLRGERSWRFVEKLTIN